MNVMCNTCVFPAVRSLIEILVNIYAYLNEQSFTLNLKSPLLSTGSTPSPEVTSVTPSEEAVEKPAAAGPPEAQRNSDGEEEEEEEEMMMEVKTNPVEGQVEAGTKKKRKRKKKKKKKKSAIVE